MSQPTAPLGERNPPDPIDIIDADVIADVAADPDPVRRNRRITAVYHRLAVKLAEQTASPNLTWCAFGTWASAAVGRMIRMEELPGEFRLTHDLSRRSGGPLSRVGHRLVHGTVESAVVAVARQVSALVADGNLMVFSTVAPTFAALSAGIDPPSDTQPQILEAHGLYLAALTETDPHRAAQSMLAANLIVGHFEQVSLQPVLESTLNVALHDVRRALVQQHRLGRALGWFDSSLSGYYAKVECVWDDLLTRYYMTLPTAGHVYRLGHDVPRLDDGSLGPLELAVLIDPEPRQTMIRFDRSAGTLVGSAARDWCDLNDRMNYIVNLFRSRQQDATLLLPPEATILT